MAPADFMNLLMDKPDGSQLRIELLRPLEWLSTYSAVTGSTIDLDLSEMGASGPALVLSILPAPEIEQGEGEVVTGRFIHSSAAVLDLVIDELPDPIGTTHSHPFWSEDRQTFVEAGDLIVGERLKGEDGHLMTVSETIERTTPTEVFNLEVNTEHVYYVSEHAVLVHNSYGITRSSAAIAPREGSRFVYRVVRPDEVDNIAIGLRGKTDAIRYPDSVRESLNHHVRYGKRAESRFISTTTDIDVARRWATESGNRIVEIDLYKVQASIYDLSTDIGRQAHLLNKPTRDLAKGSSELIIDGIVPAGALNFVR